jgi:hypothetical protein
MGVVQVHKNVYDIWVPTHFKRICSVIDALPPDADIEVSQQSKPGESGLSRELESRHLFDQTSHDAARKLTVNQAMLLRETFPPIRPYLVGVTGKHLRLDVDSLQKDLFGNQ